MKKILLVCVLAMGTSIAVNAQTTAADKNTDAVVKTEKITPSCCASKADKAKCAEMKAQADTQTDATQNTAAATTAVADAPAPKAAGCCSAGKTADQLGSKPCSGKAMAQVAKEKEEAEKKN
jgi:cellobiose-specific phosphotransferase system component IIB